MRNLTIKRTKSFVGCLVKVKIYIEDATSNELVINGVACKKLGEIKNGKEATFQIENSAAKVFAIADKLSKDYCNDFYELCEGEDDVFLSGECKFSLGSNAFRFDNNPSQAAAKNRKKGNKKGLIIFIAAIIVGFGFGYFITSSLFSNDNHDNNGSKGMSTSNSQDEEATKKDKTFSSKGMTITLTKDFKKSSYDGFTTAFESDSVAIFALKEEFSLLEGFEEYTLEEYASLVINGNNLTSATTKNKDGLTYFEYYYTNEATNEIYHYYSFVYKTKDSFWMIQFALLDENTQKEEDNIFKWAKSINFDD